MAKGVCLLTVETRLSRARRCMIGFSGKERKLGEQALTGVRLHSLPNEPALPILTPESPALSSKMADAAHSLWIGALGLSDWGFVEGKDQFLGVALRVLAQFSVPRTEGEDLLLPMGRAHVCRSHRQARPGRSCPGWPRGRVFEVVGRRRLSSLEDWAGGAVRWN
eukprot:6204983-Pleurochrysis_carterae.AAC.1